MKRISLLLIALVLSMGMKAHANQFLFLPSDDIVPVEMIATDDLGEDALGAEDIQDGEASEGSFNPGSVIIGQTGHAVARMAKNMPWPSPCRLFLSTMVTSTASCLPSSIMAIPTIRAIA